MYMYMYMYMYLCMRMHKHVCYVYNATRYGARGHGLPHTLGRTAEPGLGR